MAKTFLSQFITVCKFTYVYYAYYLMPLCCTQYKYTHCCEQVQQSKVIYLHRMCGCVLLSMPLCLHTVMYVFTHYCEQVQQQMKCVMMNGCVNLSLSASAQSSSGPSQGRGRRHIKIQRGMRVCVVCMCHTFLFEITPHTRTAVAETGRRSLRFKGKSQPFRK